MNVSLRHRYESGDIIVNNAGSLIYITYLDKGRYFYYYLEYPDDIFSDHFWAIDYSSDKFIGFED